MPLGSAFVGRQPDYDPANTAAYMFEPDDRVTETSPRPGWPTSCPPEAVGTGHFLQKPGMTGFSAPHGSGPVAVQWPERLQGFS